MLRERLPYGSNLRNFKPILKPMNLWFMNNKYDIKIIYFYLLKKFHVKEISSNPILPPILLSMAWDSL